MKSVDVSFEKDEAEVKFAPDKVLLDQVLEKIAKCGYRTGLKAPLVGVTETENAVLRAQIIPADLAPGKTVSFQIAIRPARQEESLAARDGASVRVELAAPDGLAFVSGKADAPEKSVMLSSTEEGALVKITAALNADAKAAAGVRRVEGKATVRLKSGKEEKLDVLLPLLIAGGK